MKNRIFTPENMWPASLLGLGFLIIMLAAMFVGEDTLSASGPQEYDVTTPVEFQEAIWALSNTGGTINIVVPGIWPDIHIKDVTPPNILTINGNGVTVAERGIGVQDCHNIVLKNFIVDSGTLSGASLELNDSNANIGLDNVTFDNIVVLPQKGGRGAFLGGYRAKDIKFLNCTILGPIEGTHGIYMSGGHYNPDYYCEGFVIKGCKISMQPGGRNCIQFNGRFKDIVIVNNELSHAQLNLITLIGVQGCIIRNNFGYGANRGTAVVVYDYASHWGPWYNYFEDQENIDEFNTKHWPNQDIVIEYNSFVGGPSQFSIDAYHKDDPTDGHPSILINNAVHSGFLMWNPNVGKHVIHEGWDFPPKNFIIRYNVLWSPNANIVDTYNKAEGLATLLQGNLFWNTSGKPPYVGQSGVVGGNINNTYEDPKFKLPEYGFVNLDISPNYNWNKFPTWWWPYSKIAQTNSVGSKIPPIIVMPPSATVARANTMKVELAAEMADATLSLPIR